jgi:hypothetical protein
MLEAMRLLPHNMESKDHIGGKFSYFEVNAEKQAEMDAKKKSVRRKALRLAQDATIEHIKKHLIYLGLRDRDAYGQPLTERGLRNLYEDYAESNPDKFINAETEKPIDNPGIEIGYLINKAIAEAKIDISTHPGAAHWGATGAFICALPSGKTGQEYLLEFAMLPRKESEEFKARLQQIMNS